MPHIWRYFLKQISFTVCSKIAIFAWCWMAGIYIDIQTYIKAFNIEYCRRYNCGNIIQFQLWLCTMAQMLIVSDNNLWSDQTLAMWPEQISSIHSWHLYWHSNIYHKVIDELRYIQPAKFKAHLFRPKNQYLISFWASKGPFGSWKALIGIQKGTNHCWATGTDR